VMDRLNLADYVPPAPAAPKKQREPAPVGSAMGD
jgi:hypothetical protein